MPTLSPNRAQAAIAYALHQPLVIEELSYPDPGPGEVLVRMHASGICHTDLHAIEGDWPIQPTLPLVPGHEGVGVVAKAGSGVTHLKEGDRVGLPWLHSACGLCEWCLGNWETLCPNAVYSGYTTRGTYSELALAPAAFASRIPQQLSDLEAAPILCAGVTTWKAIKETEVKPGEWLAISGIGGLGQLAIQYATAMGINVVAIDIDDRKLLSAKNLGAKIVLNATRPETAEYIQRGLGGVHGAIVTAVSLSAFRQVIDMMRRHGTCVLVGLPPGEFPVPLFDIVLKRITVRGSFVGTRLDLEEVLTFTAEHNIRSFGAETLALSAVNDGLDRLRQGQVASRLVITFQDAA